MYIIISSALEMGKLSHTEMKATCTGPSVSEQKVWGQNQRLWLAPEYILLIPFHSASVIIISLSLFCRKWH